MRARMWGAIVVAGMALAACSTPGSNAHVWSVAYDYGVPGAAVESHGEVAYYPACRNEILTFAGVTWFPFEPSNTEELPVDPLSALPPPTASADAAVTAETTTYRGPVGAVVAPSPGDDVGTLVIYEGALAYWESDSGKFHTWLTNHKIEYDWAC